MKSKQIKREEAEERQLEHDARSTEEQLRIVRDRRGDSTRETRWLIKKLILEMDSI